MVPPTGDPGLLPFVLHNLSSRPVCPHAGLAAKPVCGTAAPEQDCGHHRCRPHRRCLRAHDGRGTQDEPGG
eukprot:365661-Chlamydomonas_euryale.AAC.44